MFLSVLLIIVNFYKNYKFKSKWSKSCILTNNKDISHQVRHYSVKPRNIKLNPWWVTGFTDAEGSFSMSIYRSKTAAIGWTIEPSFSITLHKRDLELLNSIKTFFGVGSVKITGKTVQYRVRSRLDLTVIISHFNKYPLKTTKIISFLQFFEILNLINNKVHTNIKGFLQLASLINKLNRPLSESLFNKLSELGPLVNTNYQTILDLDIANKVEKLDPFWISGFITGEGSFTYFTRTRKNSVGERIKDYTLVFEVSQRTQDYHVLNLIKSYLGVGSVYSEVRGISKYRLVVKNQILSVLVPHISNYPLEGNKVLQYLAWLKIVKLLNDQARCDERDLKLENLVKELSNLK